MLHTFWLGNLRLVLDVQVSSGKQHTSAHAKAVMVGDATHPIEAIGQFHRDRADCESGFDELKNRRAMSGFTTRDINRCQTTARSCALRYNWWG